jgi:hypothetical protein
VRKSRGAARLSRTEAFFAHGTRSVRREKQARPVRRPRRIHCWASCLDCKIAAADDLGFLLYLDRPRQRPGRLERASSRAARSGACVTISIGQAHLSRLQSPVKRLIVNPCKASASFDQNVFAPKIASPAAVGHRPRCYTEMCYGRSPEFTVGRPTGGRPGRKTSCKMPSEFQPKVPAGSRTALQLRHFLEIQPNK